MNLSKHIALLTLVALVPSVVGCSSSGGAGDPPAAQQSAGASLSIVGKSGEKRVEIAQNDVDGVLSNQLELTVDGAKTTDFAKVLTAKTVEFDAGAGKTLKLVRDGNLLRLDGAAQDVGVEIDGNRFTVVAGGGRWECILNGLSTEATAKLAGAMTAGVLLALDPDVAAQAEQGRCEIACVTIIAFSIVVGVGIVAATTAFIVCETTGQSRCESIARNTCTKGASKVEKNCDIIGAFGGVFKNGKIEFKADCKITCK